MKTKTKLMLALGLAVVMAVALIQAGSWIRPTSNAVAAYSDPVGFVKIDLKRDAYTMISIPVNVEDMGMNDTDDSVACVGEMLAEVLTGGGDPLTSPNLYNYNQSTGGYDIVWLHSSGVWAEGSGLSARVLSDTNGYWIRRLADVDSDPVQAVILGDVAVADTIPVTIIAGLNMICYPYPVAKLIDTTNFPSIAEGATAGGDPLTSDNIYLYDQTTTGYKIIWLHTTDVWAEGSAVTTSVVGVAEGLFYNRYAGGTFTWDVDRPYTLP